MLYIQKGLKQSTMYAVKKTLPEVLDAWNDKKYTVTAENLHQIKSNNAWYAISGEMDTCRRSNAGVLGRDSLAIDLDYINSKITSQRGLFETISNLFNFNWYLYPTISNGIKGMRYRLVIPLISPVDANNYKLLMQGLNIALVKANIIEEIDNSNFRIAQLFGLPVKTQYSPPLLILHHKGVMLDYQNIIVECADFIKEYDATQRKYHASRKDKQTQGAKLIQQGINGVQEGNRNNYMYTLAKYWINCGIDDTQGLLDYMELINSHYVTPPLDTEELQKILKSAMK